MPIGAKMYQEAGASENADGESAEKPEEDDKDEAVEGEVVDEEKKKD